MKTIETRITIEAEPAAVWAVLMDFASYPDWNPFVRSIAGTPAVGAELAVTIAPPGAAGMAFRPRLLAVAPESELRWRGKLLLPGLFDGEHYFRLAPTHRGATDLVHGETFSGLLVPFLGAMLEKTKAGFSLMNEALKQRCEAR